MTFDLSRKCKPRRKLNFSKQLPFGFPNPIIIEIFFFIVYQKIGYPYNIQHLIGKRIHMKFTSTYITSIACSIKPVLFDITYNLLCISDKLCCWCNVIDGVD